jgi:hypothetical protein
MEDKIVTIIWLRVAFPLDSRHDDGAFGWGARLDRVGQAAVNLELEESLFPRRVVIT